MRTFLIALLPAALAFMDGPPPGTPYNLSLPFLAPQVNYAPTGAWRSSGLAAGTNGSFANSTVSVVVPCSEVELRFHRADDVKVLIGGQDPAVIGQNPLGGPIVSMNATGSTVRISKLDYGMHNFTLVFSGAGSFDGATAYGGTQWVVAAANIADPRGEFMRPLPIQNVTERIKTEGNWSE